METAIFLFATFYAIMTAAVFIIEGIFGVLYLDLVPEQRHGAANGRAQLRRAA
jgi:hypothetical protein